MGSRVTVERHVMSDQPFQDQEYWLGHRAPANDGYSMALGRALEAFGPDLLDAPDLYGTSDAETMSQLQAAVVDPETTVRVYRAVPWEHTEINPGDWITLSRGYAFDHAYSEGMAVVVADVPASRVWTDGNDPSEFGYDGPALTDLHGYREDDPFPPPGQAVLPLDGAVARLATQQRRHAAEQAAGYDSPTTGPVLGR